MSAARRARKRARVLRQMVEDERALMAARAATMVVCDKCGLVQEYEMVFWEVESDEVEIYPCQGALGMTCDGIYCTPADYYLVEISDA